jgi:hypothetical protein
LRWSEGFAKAGPFVLRVLEESDGWGWTASIETIYLCKSKHRYKTEKESRYAAEKWMVRKVEIIVSDMGQAGLSLVWW